MSKHSEAIETFQLGKIRQALALLDEVLAEEQSAEVWNDWAAIQLASGHGERAESGFRKALELDARHVDAAANLGLLLLSRGDRPGARPVLTGVLPRLPAAQQEMMRKLLAKAAEPAPRDGSRNILVASDTYPHFKTSRTDLRLMQVVTVLRELGHRVTFIAREGTNQKAYEPALSEAGVTTFCNDEKHLAVLGIEAASVDSWSLKQVLSQGQFDIAILNLDFRRGISVPEQYLGEIRRISPSARIAILCGELKGNGRQPAGMREFEAAQDLRQREGEIFERADILLLPREEDVEQANKDSIAAAALVTHACKPFVEDKAWELRGGILYAARFDRSGASEDFEWLMQEVWPAVLAQSPGMDLLVAGESVPAEFERRWSEVKWLAGRDLERMLGAARLFVSLRSSGAQDGGLLTMLANGLPGVAHGGADTKITPGVLAANSAPAFAASIAKLNQDRDLWMELQRQGRELIAKRFSNQALSQQLTEVIERCLRLSPKGASDRALSVLRIEELYCERLSRRSGDKRVLGQLEAYVRLAESYLQDKRPELARAQLRHILGRASGLPVDGQFLAQVFALLKRCYRELGDAEMAERCSEEARNSVSTKSASITTVRKNSKQPWFSVIVPTYNRLPILQKCLAALQAQTLSPSDFEVLVIDDGSSDGTEEAMRRFRAPFRFQYLRQPNSGTGAARRNGVAHAKGVYLLLMNDDTICDPDVLQQHLRAQRAYGSKDWAVMGNFEYPAAARRRALTHYFCIEPFMFPQVSMEEGCPYGYSHFITCNLSIRREAVLQTGSFDSTYKLSEDTELGIRLFERGCRVLYHPAAHAFHDHLPYPAKNLIRRARVYGNDYFHMFRNHPRVMKEWAMPVNLTALDEANALRVLAYVEEHRGEVEEAAAALEKWDDVDFEPFLAERSETASMVISLFRRAVPAVHWFYLFETMLHTMKQELGLTHLLPEERKTCAAAGAGL